MAKIVIGTAPSTGEVLVHDTVTDEYSWEPGTPDQVDSVTQEIDQLGFQEPTQYQEYIEPEVVVVPKPVVVIEKQVVYVYVTPSEDLEAAAEAETTGGYVGIEAFTWIILKLNSLSESLYEIYITINDWAWPLWTIAWPFYLASSAAASLSWGFYNLSEWAYDVALKIADILSWSTIWSYILSYVPNLEEIRDWFYYWGDYVSGVVDTWWTSTMGDVRSWIHIATEGLDTLKESWSDFWNITWPEWTGQLDDLRSAWGNFWSVTFPTLVSFGWLNTWWESRLADIDQLTNAKIKDWFPFYDELASLWSGIREFFTDPEEWLYKATDRIIERFW